METNDYALGCILQSEPKHLEVMLIRSITPADTDILNTSMKELGDFASSCTLYESCHKNYESIHSYYTAIKDNFILNRNRSYEFIEDSVQEMNRLLLNYLSSYRTFIDHLTIRYARLGRQGYTFLNDFKKIQAACYDQYFDYRFFSKLRNYIQHCGLPLDAMNIEEYPDANHNVVIEVSISMKRDNLISNYEKWGKVIDDLRKQPTKMELFPYLEQFHSQIQLINIVSSAFEISLITNACNFINKLVEEVLVQYPDGTPFVGLFEDAGVQRQLHQIHFPFHIMKKVQQKSQEIQNFRNQRKMNIFEFQNFPSQH